MNHLAFNSLPRLMPAVAASSAFFPVDIEEDDSQYRIRADLPGVAKNDISVRVEDGVVSIAAKFEPRKGAVRSERPAGEYERSFRLPRHADSGRIEAESRDGVLTLVIPKSESAAARRIDIR